MDEMLQDFLTEAGELLSDVDNKLVELEKRPGDGALLNDIFRGFHTIKGGAGFLNLPALVELCHLTENLFDSLRKRELDAERGDHGRDPRGDRRGARHVRRPRARQAAAAGGCRAARAAARGRCAASPRAIRPRPGRRPPPTRRSRHASGEPDWEAFYELDRTRRAGDCAGRAPSPHPQRPPRERQPGDRGSPGGTARRRTRVAVRARPPSASTPRASTRCSTSRARSGSRRTGSTACAHEHRCRTSRDADAAAQLRRGGEPARPRRSATCRTP